MKNLTQTEVNLIETPSNSYPESSKVDTLQANPGLLITVGFFLLWATATVLYARVPKHVQKWLFNLQPRHKVPCRNCKFFNCNPYIQCAIHPHTVQTAKAIDCQDYQNKAE